MIPPRFKFFILPYLILSFSIYSQTINSIEIEGANKLSQNTYVDFLSLQNSKLLNGLQFFVTDQK